MDDTAATADRRRRHLTLRTALCTHCWHCTLNALFAIGHLITFGFIVYHHHVLPAVKITKSLHPYPEGST